jgi:hypothetical protein
MKVSRWGFQLKRIHLAGLGIVLITWFCCGVASNDERPRNAQAHTEFEDTTEDTGIAREETLPEETAGTRIRRDIISNAGGTRAASSSSSKATEGVAPGTVVREATGGTQAKVVFACGATRSNYREFAHFGANTLPRRWGLNPGTSRPGATLTSTKRGPASNPSLCAEGCAVLAFTIPTGSGWGGGAIVDEWFSSPTNLYGSAIRANVALEVGRPTLPVNVRIFTQGDLASDYNWGTTASLSTATLTDVSRFHEIVLHATDRNGTKPFCASATGAIGIQVQRSRSSSVDIPVKLYIKSVTVGDTDTTSDWTPGVTNPQIPGEIHGHANTPTFEHGDGYCRLADNGALAIAADDWVVAGTCQGYGYTYAIGQQLDTKITPSCSASRCTPKLSKISAKGLCASGTIAADPTWKSKAGLGLDFDPMKSGTTGIALTYQMMGTTILRFLLDDGAGNFYCTELDETDEAGTTINLPWETFTTRCWDRWEPGNAYNPSLPIKGIQLSASCLASKTSWFDMCVTGLTTY